jgi:hypothetical protein
MTIVQAEDPSWDLPKLNVFVAEQENVLQGVLTKIGNDGSKTTLDIDDGVNQRAPDKNSVITTGSPPAGATKLNTAQIFVSGRLESATAYRPA